MAKEPGQEEQPKIPISPESKPSNTMNVPSSSSIEPRALPANLWREHAIKIVAVGLLAILLGAAGWFFFTNRSPLQDIYSGTSTPTTQSTTGDPKAGQYKYYTNQKLGLRLQYLSQWHVAQNGESTTFSNDAVSQPINEEDVNNQASFRVFVLNNANPKLLSIEQWFDGYFKAGFPSEPLSKKTISLANKQAVQIEVSEIGKSVHIYLPIGNNVVEISYGLSAKQFIGEYEKILNSIELFDPSLITYTNTELGLTFQYPNFGIPTRVHIDYETISSDIVGVDIETLNQSANEYYPDFGFVIHDVPVGQSLEQWFQENVDFKGILLREKAFQLKQLPNGWPALVLSKLPLPDDYLKSNDSQPVPKAVALSQSALKIVSADKSQDHQLGLYYSREEFDKIIIDVLGSMQFK
jgi:hypothetical protein